MHVRVRICGKHEAVVSVESKLTKIDKFRVLVQDKFNIKPNLQRLFYGGKLLENGYTFHDYNIKLNDVIQLMVQTQTSPEKKKTLDITASENKGKDEETKIEYKDAVSMFYNVGDFIDMRDKEYGAWFEGRIVRIVSDPDTPHPDINSDNENRPNKENDPGKKQPPVNRDKPKNGIERFFSKSPKLPKSSQKNGTYKNEDHLLFEVQIEKYDDSNIYCKLKDIRPRARNIVTIKDLYIGRKVMVNHNPEQPHEKGYWYDFTVNELVLKRHINELIGTIYLGSNCIPQNDTRVILHDNMFAIEEVISLADRTEEYKELMKTQPKKRSAPLDCLACRDDEDALCKNCGCYVCSGKQFPEKILLCDECNKGFHMECLDPPLKSLPIDDWYCTSCKRDPNQVVAPGAAKQKKRKITTNRDWGRGMACVGKTKTCSMPANHFGPIPGLDVGMCWRFRIQLSESGVHRPPVSGIHGRDIHGAYSIVLSGGYEDDVDYGNEFTYTGSGGRDLSGNKRTAEQSCDQTLTRENRALARNCAVKQVNEEGADAGEDWRLGRPVRVVRSYKMLKHFPQYAPKEGIRYDGIYKVVKYYPEIGKSGFRVWKYLLRRDDDSPAPWEPGAKHFDIIDFVREQAMVVSFSAFRVPYEWVSPFFMKLPKFMRTYTATCMITIQGSYPDGYLEAEAERKALKEKKAKGPKGKGPKSKGRQPVKRALHESNHSSNSDDDTLPPSKKKKTPKDDETLEPFRASPKIKSARKSKSQKSPPKVSIINMLKTTPTPEESEDRGKSTLSEEEKGTIALDTLNAPLWEQCLDVCTEKGKKEFVDYVCNVFLCIICQDVTASPVTTPCRHNFCQGCLKRAFKATGIEGCPCCRRYLSLHALEPNYRLKAALRAIMPGYDLERS